jgi:hypothetical protein
MAFIIGTSSANTQILAAGTTAERPASPSAGQMRYNSTTSTFEGYAGTAWAVIGNASPADTGSGGGWSIAQGADSTNITGATSSSTTYYASAWRVSAGGGGDPLSYVCTGSSANFAFHTGHAGNSTQWPFYIAMNVSMAEKGKVLNQINWYAHGNAIGNVDIYGSNQSITSSNFNLDANYTYLGRGHFGGYGGGGADCTVKTVNFNSNSYGYKWYMLKCVDNNSTSLAYPNVGRNDGWAMYGLRLNKV